jgi:DNA-binding response OmpR family regulator
MLPGIDGFETCRRLRRLPKVAQMPVIFMTALSDAQDKVRAFAAGADDYVTKPFGARELLARVEVIARRVKNVPADPEIVEIDDCRFDLGRCEAQRGKKTISLTPREAGILRWLYRHRARVVSRAELLEQIWGAAPDMETRTVDVTLANLRHKIERDPADPRIIVCVKGAGYAWGDKPR